MRKIKQEGTIRPRTFSKLVTMIVHCLMIIQSYNATEKSDLWSVLILMTVAAPLKRSTFRCLAMGVCLQWFADSQGPGIIFNLPKELLTNQINGGSQIPHNNYDSLSNCSDSLNNHAKNVIKWGMTHLTALISNRHFRFSCGYKLMTLYMAKGECKSVC